MPHSDHESRRIARLIEFLDTQKDHAINVSETARIVGVSRSFLYKNADAAALLAQHKRTDPPLATYESEWKERCLNAESRIQAINKDLRILRRDLSEALGRLGEAEPSLAKAAIYRLKRRVDALEAEVERATLRADEADQALDIQRQINRDLWAQLNDMKLAGNSLPDQLLQTWRRDGME